MPEEDIEIFERQYIQGLKEARDVGVVLKSKLASFRSMDPDVLVFVFEGIEDKSVYYAWIKRIDSTLVYEPFPCGGKGQLLKLKDQLERDKSELASKVFFFMDRDFDDYRGENESEELFMTQAYSFENYLVNQDVLEELLKNELHCHAEPSCRAGVVDLFGKLYADFLAVTRDINFRIYISKKCDIRRVQDLPQKINKIAKVSLSTVLPSDNDLKALVSLEREPREEEIATHLTEFEALDAATRYRGKFALMFFRTWLAHLAADRNSEQSVHFAGVSREGLRARDYFELDSLAGKASLPDGLERFVRRVGSGGAVSPAIAA